MSVVPYLASALIHDASFDSAPGHPQSHHHTCRTGADDEDVDMVHRFLRGCWVHGVRPIMRLKMELLAWEECDG